MSPEVKRETGLKKLEPGLYSLSPDELKVRPVRFTKEYQEYLERMRARMSGNPIKYFRVWLNQVRRPPIEE